MTSVGMVSCSAWTVGGSVGTLREGGSLIKKFKILKNCIQMLII